MRTNTFLSLAFLVVAGGALAGCGEEPIPVNVSYATDIKPLMEARCIRCHGGGGTLNDDPYSVPTLTFTQPQTGDFTRLETVGIIKGLGFYTGGGVGVLKIYIDPPNGGRPTMPPDPAPKLTSREKEMLLKWAAGNPTNP
jgi:hypothetical protein